MYLYIWSLYDLSSMFTKGLLLGLLRKFNLSMASRNSPVQLHLQHLSKFIAVL